jgi:hypothetical protein
MALRLNWGEGELEEGYQDSEFEQAAKIWGVDLSYKYMAITDTGTPISPYFTFDFGGGYGQLRYEDMTEALTDQTSGDWTSDNAFVAHAGAGLGIAIAFPQDDLAMVAEARANYVNYFVSSTPATNVETTPVGVFVGITRWIN